MEYVFTFEVYGDFDIEMKDKESAKDFAQNLSTEEIIEISNANLVKIKCIGRRCQDGSIEYFE